MAERTTPRRISATVLRRRLDAAENDAKTRAAKALRDGRTVDYAAGYLYGAQSALGDLEEWLDEEDHRG